MHIILAFPFQSFCKQQSHASLEGNSALRTDASASARPAVQTTQVRQPSLPQVTRPCPRSPSSLAEPARKPPLHRWTSGVVYCDLKKNKARYDDARSATKVKTTA
jgi:hypothetical protein